MDSGSDGSALFVSTPAFLRVSAEWSSKFHLQYQLRREFDSVFAGDNNDPTRKRNFEPPSFDQKIINMCAQPVGVATAASPKKAEVKRPMSGKIGGLAWRVPICAETALCGAPAAN